MPLQELQLTPTGAITTETIDQVVEGGVLTAVSAIYTGAVSVADVSFVRVGIATPDVSTGTITLLLCSGVPENQNGPAWSGAIRMLKGMRLVMRLNTTGTTPIRLAWVTEKD